MKRGSLGAALGLAAGLQAWAQAPLLQDGSAFLRQARRTWVAGEETLPPLAIPSLEVGLGGAASDGPFTPLIAGEGLGQGAQGWGLGLQGRYFSGGWSMALAAAVLRDGPMTQGHLLRGEIAYRWDPGWRFALEQQPFAWGSGLTGGDLLGDAARPFPRLSLETPEFPLLAGRWRVEAFAGRLEADRPVPEWIADREARAGARAQGMDLSRPWIYGGRLRASFGSLVEVRLGSIRMDGGSDAHGQAAPASAARASTLAEVTVRVPALARLAGAQGAALHLSRSAAPDSRSVTLVPARTLGSLLLVWERWDLGVEYAGGSSPDRTAVFDRPAYLAGFSSHGDSLGPAFGPWYATRTLDLGLPLFFEGQGRLTLVRGTSALASAPSFWFLQGQAQWRTPTGRVGASLASRRNEGPGALPRWGWTFAVFQSFRVF